MDRFGRSVNPFGLLSIDMPHCRRHSAVFSTILMNQAELVISAAKHNILDMLADKNSRHVPGLEITWLTGHVVRNHSSVYLEILKDKIMVHLGD